MPKQKTKSKSRTHTSPRRSKPIKGLHAVPPVDYSVMTEDQIIAEVAKLEERGIQPAQAPAGLVEVAGKWMTTDAQWDYKLEKQEERDGFLPAGTADTNQAVSDLMAGVEADLDDPEDF